MPNTTFQIDCFGMTDVGLVREQNEDVWAAFPQEGLFILADGMGGRRAGEVAAREVVEALSALVQRWQSTERMAVEEGVSFFREAVEEINSRIYQSAEKDPALKGMGTTLCVLYFLKNRAILAHVGDSRIYRLRSSKLEHMTEDHSLISELVAMGTVKPGDAALFPYKHILTRAIGTQPTVTPTINSIELAAHDLFLLCSDGLSNFVTDEEIMSVLRTPSSMKERGKELIKLANKHGGGDNITLILVDVGDDLSR